jgi:hypothetical protein
MQAHRLTQCLSARTFRKQNNRMAEIAKETT